MTTAITDIQGIGPSTGKILIKHGFKTAEGIAGAAVDKLAQVPGFGKVRSAKVIAAAKRIVSASRAGRTRATSTAVNRGLQKHRQAAVNKSTKKTSEKQRKEKLRKEKQRREKLRKEKQRKEKLRKEKQRKQKLRKEKQRKEKQRKEKLRKEK
ncbi:MAG: helix-hairpin-helix domain-containing protein, partial [Gammaproteobacteria bacterium]|nr:helix-hairpin-helix domain-containing protein [Gammaproteobacteria bacterium]